MGKNYIRAATLMAGLLLSACGSKLDKVRDQFIDSCSSDGANEEMCECAFDKLQAHYGEKGLIAIESEGYPPPDFDNQLVEAAKQCKTR
ncbi:hypothetical protein O4D10_02105 [Xanthomonas citri pv. citri]|uniref:hypothetical protein n=1 Tax=Xanthomonas citri TaxID=346 RepID=UPI0036D7D974